MGIGVLGLRCVRLRCVRVCEECVLKFSSILFSIGGLIGAALVALFAWAFYLSWDVARWDKKIDALCAANGGADVATRVYETAVAPETKEYFRGSEPMRSLHVIERRSGIDYGPKYPYVMETRVVEILNDRDPSVVKYTERIVRVSDNKILAERFRYQRAGGGIPLFDPDEIRNCPKDTQRQRLDINVFLNHPRRNVLDTK